jgi:hypothetical protein
MRMTASEFATGTQSIPPMPIRNVVAPTRIFREHDPLKDFSFLHPTGRNDYFHCNIIVAAIVGGRLHKEGESLGQIRRRNHIDDRQFLVTHSTHVALECGDLFVYGEQNARILQENTNLDRRIRTRKMRIPLHPTLSAFLRVPCNILKTKNARE